MQTLLYRNQPFKQQHETNAITKRYFTVILSSELTNGVMPFRCYNCGSIVFQYYNQPSAGFEGAINIADCQKATDHLCKRCNIIFRVT